MAGTGLSQGMDYSNQILTVDPALVPGWSQTGQIGYQSCVHTDISKLVEALTFAQLDFSPLLKKTENPYFKSHYADLAAVIASTLPALNKHGLTVIQLTSTDFINKAGIVTTILAHKSGQTITSTLSVPTGAKFDAQSLGSALTYGKRYAYQAIIGVAADVDDDANSISTGFSQELKIPKYEPKPGKKPFTGPNWKSPENGQVKGPLPETENQYSTGVPKANMGVPPKPVNVNTNANFTGADHEPTKEEKDFFKKKARLYVQTLLPEAGVANPAETLKNFVEKLTGQTDTKKLSYLQWCVTLEALDNAVLKGNLKAVVEG